MTTITAFSDSHGFELPSKLVEVANESNLVFFLGDGAFSLGDILLHKGFYGVKGNCDLAGFEQEQVVEAEKVRILLTRRQIRRKIRFDVPLYASAGTQLPTRVVRSHAFWRGGRVRGSHAREPRRNKFLPQRSAVLCVYSRVKRKICRQNSKYNLIFLTSNRRCANIVKH